jgi:glutathione S-transferase
MTITLYGSQISTFARKVAVALDLKQLTFEHVDALTPQMRDKLREANPRLEVPVLFDGEVTVINSSDIIQYLDHRYAARPLFPSNVAERVVARAFERLADQRLDPIVVDCSYWHWADRQDIPPDGLSRQPRPTLIFCSTGSRRCCALGQSRGRSARQEWLNARGSQILPPCAPLVSRLMPSDFQAPLHGSARSETIQSSWPTHARPLRS